MGDHPYLLLRSPIRIYAILGILLNSFIGSSAVASPWVREPGSLFLSTGSEIFTAEGDFFFEAPPLENRLDDRFLRYQSTNYLEIGVFQNLQLTAKVNYGFTTLSNTGFSVTDSGLSEFEGRVQYEFERGRKHVFSVSGAGGISNSTDSGVRPELVSDGPDGELRFHYGRTHFSKPIKLYSTTEIAYRRRFGTPADQLRLDIQIGLEPFKRVLFLIDSLNTISIRNSHDLGADFDAYKIQPSIAIKIFKRWRLQSGANFEIAGRNLTLGRSIFVNLWSEF